MAEDCMGKQVSNEPMLPPWTKSHWSVTNPKLALPAFPSTGWNLLLPHLHPAARSDPPHAPGPAISSLLKPEHVGREEGFTALLQQSSCPWSTATTTSSPVPPGPSHTVDTVYQLRNGRDKKYQVLRNHFQAPVVALDNDWSAAARINVSSTKMLLERSGKAKLQVLRCRQQVQSAYQ